MATNPLLAAFDNLDPAVKQNIMAAHGLAPNPLANTAAPSPSFAQIRASAVPGAATRALGPEPAQTIPPIGGAPTVLPIGGTAPPVKGPIDAEQQKLAEMRAKPAAFENVYNKVAQSGFGKAHPTAGKVLGALGQTGATIGDIALSGLFPGVGSFVPGTTARRGVQIGAQTNALNTDVANAQKQAQTQAEQAQADEARARGPLIAAQTAEAQARAAAAGQPAPKEEKWEVSKDYEGPNGEPVEVEQNSGQMRVVGQTGPAFKRVAAPKAEKPDTPEQQYIDEYQRLNPKATVGEAVHAYAAATQKPERGPTIIQQGAEIDRIAGRLGKPHETAVTAGNNQLDRMDEARAMINGSAEAQALGIPKVLTALVSGQGTGVRITQPELNAIGKARGFAGDVQGTINALAGKGKLTADQQRQITGILDDAKRRLQEKMNISNQALDAMNGAETRADVIAADKKARTQMTELEKYGHYEGQTVTLGGKEVTITKIHPDGTFEY